jgi:hypothetical protein
MQQQYEQENDVLIKQETGTSDVVVFVHTRKNNDKIRLHARHVHADYSPTGAQQKLVDVLGS